MSDIVLTQQKSSLFMVCHRDTKQIGKSSIATRTDGISIVFGRHNKAMFIIFFLCCVCYNEQSLGKITGYGIIIIQTQYVVACTVCNTCISQITYSFAYLQIVTDIG